MNPEIEAPLWHQLTVDEAVERVESDLGVGLTDDEVAKRLERYGPNRLPEVERQGPIVRFLLQFHNVLIYVLLAAAVLTGLLAHWIDTVVILAVVVVNAIIGFVQEGKAEKALSSIRSMLSVHAWVIREGERREIEAENLVPGDVVLLKSGDKVPADLRLTEVRSLRVDEATLTGESVPVSKQVDPVDGKSGLGDRFSIAYSGTIVTYGQGKGVVVATGAATELGRISRLVGAAPTLTTPLLRQLGQFGRTLTMVILAMSALVLPFALFVRDMDFPDAFMAVVGLAVAAIPEGLPAIVTITLAIGVQAMARRHAIIRRLPAVETLGSVSVICSDKTGTLTKGEMTVASVATAEGWAEVRGTGYRPEGEVVFEGAPVRGDDGSALAQLARVGLLCNDSRLRRQGDQWVVEGDPTEGALVALAHKVGLDPAAEAENYARLDTIPFESEHKFMATLHRGPEGPVVFLKGAPERVIERCGRQAGPSGPEPFDADAWNERMDEMASRGERMLAFAWKQVEPNVESIGPEDVRDGFVFLGVTGIIDPPRDEAVEAVRECHEAGISVVMITGDHVRTTEAIAERIGIRSPGGVVAGHELEEAGDAELIEIAERCRIFARTSPEHKLRLVRALQMRGKVVAMTGDGVNDAPALKSADVGVAMGIKGTEAAKEASEMVLADDNFASIAHAVEEGRTVYDNIRKAILFLLPTNGAEALVIVAALLLGRELPVTPAQILWVNMITAVTLGLALAFEPAEHDVMKRPPRAPREPILSRFFVWRIMFASVLIMLGTVSLFEFKLFETKDLDAARTVAVATLVAAEIFYLLNSRFTLASSLRLDVLTANRAVAVAIGAVALAQLGFTYLPFLNALFGSRPLPWDLWGPILAVGAGVFALIELEKMAVRWWVRRERRSVET
ncbi:MAG: cation-transporting P-type ATPase [Fimbriimonadaceae bacterium]